MAGLYDKFEGILAGSVAHSFTPPAESGGPVVEFRRGEADDGTKSIRLLVDGLDVLYADEDGQQGMYVHPFSWVAKHGREA